MGPLHEEKRCGRRMVVSSPKIPPKIPSKKKDEERKTKREIEDLKSKGAFGKRPAFSRQVGLREGVSEGRNE